MVQRTQGTEKTEDRGLRNQRAQRTEDSGDSEGSEDRGLRGQRIRGTEVSGDREDSFLRTSELIIQRTFSMKMLQDVSQIR